MKREPITFRYDEIDAQSRALIDAGVAAIRRINSHENFAHWLAVGLALDEMQRSAMRLAHANTPHGPPYVAAYKVIAAANPDLAAIASGTRAHAVWLAQHRTAIEEWHATLPANIRQLVNHPTTIKRRYEAAHVVPVAGKPVHAGGGLKPEVVRLQSELDASQAEVARLKRTGANVTEGQDWTWADDPADIAAAWVRLQPTKAPRIASKVLELTKSTTKKPRGKVNRQPAGERHWGE